VRFASIDSEAEKHSRAVEHVLEPVSSLTRCACSIKPQFVSLQLAKNVTLDCGWKTVEGEHVWRSALAMPGRLCASAVCLPGCSLSHHTAGRRFRRPGYHNLPVLFPLAHWLVSLSSRYRVIKQVTDTLAIMRSSNRLG
jgi:hypothetical protein